MLVYDGIAIPLNPFLSKFKNAKMFAHSPQCSVGLP